MSNKSTVISSNTVINSSNINNLSSFTSNYGNNCYK